MNVFYILNALTSCVLTCSEVAVCESKKGGVNLHEEDDRSLVPQTIVKTCLYLTPLVLIHSIEESSTHKDKGGNSNQIVIGKVDK